MPVSSTSMMVFDRGRVRQSRERSVRNFSRHDFLFRWASAQLSDRLMDINRKFDRAFQIGSRGIIDSHPKIKTLIVMDMTAKPVEEARIYTQGTEELLPLAPSSIDLALSTLCLHSVNDLPGTLVQIRRALKPDGLFLACLLGGETLHELRQTLMQTELELFSGASPRISPFSDKQQMAGLMQRAGFSLPVVDSEIVKVTYENIHGLLTDLRGMGESNSVFARNRQYPGRSFFGHAAQSYKKHYSESPSGRIVATFESIFLLGWSPHNSQQKPLRRGSAEHSLANALSTHEIKTGDETQR